MSHGQLRPLFLFLNKKQDHSVPTIQASIWTLQGNCQITVGRLLYLRKTFSVGKGFRVDIVQDSRIHATSQE